MKFSLGRRFAPDRAVLRADVSGHTCPEGKTSLIPRANPSAEEFNKSEVGQCWAESME